MQTTYSLSYTWPLPTPQTIYSNHGRLVKENIFPVSRSDLSVNPSKFSTQISPIRSDKHLKNERKFTVSRIDKSKAFSNEANLSLLKKDKDSDLELMSSISGSVFSEDDVYLSPEQEGILKNTIQRLKSSNIGFDDAFQNLQKALNENIKPGELVAEIKTLGDEIRDLSEKIKGDSIDSDALIKEAETIISSITNALPKFWYYTEGFGQYEEYEQEPAQDAQSWKEASADLIVAIKNSNLLSLTELKRLGVEFSSNISAFPKDFFSNHSNPGKKLEEVKTLLGLLERIDDYVNKSISKGRISQVIAFAINGPVSSLQEILHNFQIILEFTSDYLSIEIMIEADKRGVDGSNFKNLRKGLRKLVKYLPNISSFVNLTKDIDQKTLGEIDKLLPSLKTISQKIYVALMSVKNVYGYKISQEDADKINRLSAAAEDYGILGECLDRLLGLVGLILKYKHCQDLDKKQTILLGVLNKLEVQPQKKKQKTRKNESLNNGAGELGQVKYYPNDEVEKARNELVDCILKSRLSNYPSEEGIKVLSVKCRELANSFVNEMPETHVEFYRFYSKLNELTGQDDQERSVHAQTYKSNIEVSKVIEEKAAAAFVAIGSKDERPTIYTARQPRINPLASPFVALLRQISVNDIQAGKIRHLFKADGERLTEYEKEPCKSLLELRIQKSCTLHHYVEELPLPSCQNSYRD